MWIESNGATFITQGKIITMDWGGTLSLTDLTAFMTVNALTTGLIFKVFREVKRVATSDEKYLKWLTTIQ
jgi:hypothetical protein